MKEEGLRDVFVSIFQNARNGGIPCHEWLSMRVESTDRQSLIENILYNCDLKITKSGDDAKPLQVTESQDVPELPQDLQRQ